MLTCLSCAVLLAAASTLTGSQAPWGAVHHMVVDGAPGHLCTITPIYSYTITPLQIFTNTAEHHYTNKLGCTIYAL